MYVTYSVPLSFCKETIAFLGLSDEAGSAPLLLMNYFAPSLSCDISVHSPSTKSSLFELISTT